MIACQFITSDCYQFKSMLDKLTDAANILIAKVSKDELEEKLVLATSEENWQTPTNILHQIANAAYNYEKWQKINDFIWDKLKKKSTWRKIMKTLNLVEFLIKNGSPSAIKSFKYDVYQFKSFSDYQATSDGVDRGEAIREKAKQIVQLLSNDEHLEEEREKAKKIRQKMSGVTGSGNYGSYGNYDGGQKYGNYNNKSYSQKSNSGNYNYGNSDKGGLGVYGNYTTGKSTLDKYKSDKDKGTATSYKPATNVPDITGFGGATTSQGASITQQQAPKKPFQKVAPKLGKPSQAKKQQPKSIIPNITGQTPANTANKTNILDMDDIFNAGATAPSIKSTPTNQNIFPNNNNVAAGNGMNAQQEQQKLLQQQMLLKQQQLLAQQQQQQLELQKQMLIQQQNAMNMNLFAQTAPVNQPQPYNQPYSPPFNQQNYGNQLYGGLSLGQPAQPFSFGAPAYPQAPIAPVYQPYQAPTAPSTSPFSFGAPASNQITLSQFTKKDDDFGSFQSAPSQTTANVKWLSNHEKGLIDFTDFSSEIKTSQDMEPAKPKVEKGNNIKINAWDW